MDDNWIVENLENALATWNEKLAEIWQLVSMTPQEFKGGGIWNIVVQINGALQAIGYGLLVLFFAFFCFASSIRLYGHAGFMIGTCSAPGEEERRIHVSAACLEQAARQFHLGMRAFYFLVPLVLWLFGPVFLALGAMGMLLALYRLDRMPSGVERGKLELPCRKDIDCRG